MAMSDSSFHTVMMHNWLERIQEGDAAASEKLLRAVCGRLERLARKMLKGFPGVMRWVETDDVLQNALLRLLRALRAVKPGSTREFFALAATQIRRELLDLARHYFGPLGEGANRGGSLNNDQNASSLDHQGPEAPDESPSELEEWCLFHQEVEKLPALEREVVGLLFYHGWSQAEVAQLLHINERTVRRRWQAALLKLHHLMKGAMTEEERL